MGLDGFPEGIDSQPDNACLAVVELIGQILDLGLLIVVESDGEHFCHVGKKLQKPTLASLICRKMTKDDNAAPIETGLNPMKTPAFSVRLDDDQATQIEALAKRFRVKEIDVIRWAVDALIEYVHRHGGKLHLPVDFDAIWQDVQATAERNEIALIAETPPAKWGGKQKPA